jgi:hypothetical protein
MRRRRGGGLAVALAALALVAVAGCRQDLAQRGQPAPSRDLMADAIEAMRRPDYQAAVTLLRQVVSAVPAHAEAHYRLAVSASHLDFTDEAAREFEWVVAHGAPGSAEVSVARQWLAARSRPAQAPSDARPQPNGAETPEPQRAALSGRVQWGDRGALEPKPFFRLFLKGAPGSPVEDEFHRFQTEPDGSYRLGGLVPGEYRLTDRVSGSPLWRLRVTLRPGSRTTLDLTPANSLAVRDDFPEPSR